MNHTPNELDIDTESRHLWRGQWEPAESMPPEVISPGTSAVWHCKASRFGQGVEGSVTYRVAGEVPHDKVRFAWKNRYFGSNHYDAQTTRDGYVVDVQGGDGDNAIVGFVFR